MICAAVVPCEAAGHQVLGAVSLSNLNGQQQFLPAPTSGAALGAAMPLSRTRSLLANINGVGSPGQDANTSSSSSLLTEGHAALSISSTHLPPLKLPPQQTQTLPYSNMKTQGQSQSITQLHEFEDTNSNTDVQNGGGQPNSVDSSSLTSSSLPVVRPPSSTDSSSLKNGSTRQPKTYVATPEQVMKYYMNKLTPYEHKEIFNYPQIYFIGANAKKRPGIIGSGNQAISSNYGYDDHQGSYIHIPHDHIQYRYEVLKVIGKGSFGQVVKAYDHKSHLHVALKIVRNEKRFHRQAQEEIRILEHLRKQDKDNTMNIIHMYDHFTFRSHTCITFELLSINLYELIKKNKFMGFSLQLVRKFAHSLLLCLDALYKNKIIHCDMKPENVLLKQQGRSGIKVKRPPRLISMLTGVVSHWDN
ncbi:unnamed protein product, partial [Meganyctiphanes norvegica]